MHEEAVDMRLDILKIIRIGWTLIAATATRRIIVDGGWPAPEVFVGRKMLSDVFIADYFPANDHRHSTSPAGGKPAHRSDQQGIDHCAKDDHDCRQLQGR